MKQPSRIQLTSVASLLALGFLAATATPAHALTWFDGGTGSWETGGPLNWDSNTTAWSNNADAVFNGAAGGTVTVNSALQIGNVSFGASAGSYTIDNTGGYQMDFNGATGITTDPASAVQLISSTGTINFNAGSSGNSKITVDSTGTVAFNGSSNAGTSNLTVSGGNLDFYGTSSASTAVITNTGGIIAFHDTATGGSASLANAAVLDISGTSASTVTLGSLVNSADIGFGPTQLINGNIAVGAKTLQLSGGLSLDTSNSFTGSINTLSYTVATTSTSGTIVLTGGSLIGSGTNGTEIDLNGVGTPGAPNVPFVLIDWSAAAATGVDLTDFYFGPGGAPADHSLAGYKLAIQGDQLVLVPEPATFAMPLAAILGMVALRRKTARRTA